MEKTCEISGKGDWKMWHMLENMEAKGGFSGEYGKTVTFVQFYWGKERG